MNQRQFNENPVEFKGSGSAYFAIWIVNILLSIITLGIYSAWAKVRTKKYFYENTEIANHSFRYHATPIQILKGRIIAIICLLIWMVSNTLFPVASLVLLLLFYLAMPYLIRGNTRFDAAMTSYRNVHFNFSGSLKDAYIVFLGKPLCVLLVILGLIFVATLGNNTSTVGILVPLLITVISLLSVPWVISGIARYFANNYRYGNYQFSADISTAKYLKIYALASILFVLLSFALVGSFSLFMGSDLSRWIESYSTLFQNGPNNDPIALFAVLFFVYICFFLVIMMISAFIKVQVRNYIFAQVTIRTEESSNTLDNVEIKKNIYHLRSEMTIFGYLWLVLSNFILQVITIGLARPWVKVRTQRYLATVSFLLGDLDLLLTEDTGSTEKSAIADELAQTFDLDIGIG